VVKPNTVNTKIRTKTITHCTC